MSPQVALRMSAPLSRRLGLVLSRRWRVCCVRSLPPAHASAPPALSARSQLLVGAPAGHGASRLQQLDGCRGRRRAFATAASAAPPAAPPAHSGAAFKRPGRIVDLKARRLAAQPPPRSLRP